MNKKDLIVVALATFCLTSTLFMILPSRSTERDPWADVSGPIQGEPDGTINMRDINYEIQHFNQDVSNMTRNVNVTNWLPLAPVKVLYNTFDLTWNSSGLWVIPQMHYSAYPLYVGDYTTMSIILESTNLHTNNGTVIIGVKAWWADEHSFIGYPTIMPKTHLILGEGTPWQTGITTYSILSPYIRLQPEIINDREKSEGEYAGNATVSVYLYLSNGGQGGTRSAGDEISYGLESNRSSLYLGKYPTQGYKGMTLVIGTNVTWSYFSISGCDAYDNGYIKITNDSTIGFSKTIHFDVVSPFVLLQLSLPSATPYYIQIFIWYMD